MWWNICRLRFRNSYRSSCYFSPLRWLAGAKKINTWLLIAAKATHVTVLPDTFFFLISASSVLIFHRVVARGRRTSGFLPLLHWLHSFVTCMYSSRIQAKRKTCICGCLSNFIYLIIWKRTSPACEGNTTLCTDVFNWAHLGSLWGSVTRKNEQTASVYPEDLSLIMTPHQNKNFQQIWNLIPSIYMHSNNVLRNIFSLNQDIGMIILHQYSPLTSHPPCSSAINVVLVQLLFFSLWGYK